MPTLTLSLLVSIAAAPLPADDSPWRSIPLVESGKVASDWKYVGWGTMKVQGDRLVTTPDERGMGLLVYTKEKFGDCQIRVVYRPKDARSNAGVFVRIDDNILDWIEKDSLAVRRDETGALSPEMLAKMREASETEQAAWYAVHHGYEVQMCDTGDALHRTGAIYSLAPSAYQPPAEPAGAWRTMIITLDGNSVRIEQDGEHLTTFDPTDKGLPERKNWFEPKRDPRRPQTGYVGLQIHDPGDIVHFREVSVRPLPRKP